MRTKKRQQVPNGAERLYRVLSPYCLKKQPDGRYLILNREYQPLLVKPSIKDRVDIESLCYNLDITPELASRLSWNGSDNVDEIWLYNDATNPVNGGKALEIYLERYTLLMGCQSW